ncbi:uncharacterized protein BO95DRAFT_460630 [Aspergillus brunneoviolaceus CBS 621.78]|uniref:Uncharacterized protein n=1 Tax=Aspergillus brunneoviolaceus CBS 621.78 TaxID=1450534 RepID=A0ACD1GI31_9EURO|nr:hypothetical protein BO95DRAFT_460630 [Aspergillus brunneoviolaceus CBS 621.78]RAH48769.1 hypothetical protein BO95DRAFT_460630 [Aspergillus brunneoviolaceus CBS 621.78]
MSEVANGIGRHIITLTAHESIMQMKWKVVNLHSYTIAIITIKLSILALLARIFSTAPRSFHIGIWMLIEWMILWAAALVLAYCVQCRPFASQWDPRNYCHSRLKLEYSASILNAVHDVLTFCLPQRIIWNLHLAARKRLAVSMAFFIGFVALLKIAYIQGAPGTSHKSDTYAIAPALINALEPLLASICSCLPAIPYFFCHVRLDGFYQLSSFFRSTRRLHGSRHFAIKNSSASPRYPPSKGLSRESTTELAQAVTRGGLAEKQRGRASGSWQGLLEITAYAVLTMAAVSNSAVRSVAVEELRRGIVYGRAFLEVKLHKLGKEQPVWVEKVLFHSPLLCSGFCIAALQAPSFTAEVPIRQPRTVVVNVPTTTLEKFRQFYSLLPLLAGEPTWQLRLCLNEAGLWYPGLAAQRHSIFPRDGMSPDGYLEYIPQTVDAVQHPQQTRNGARPDVGEDDDLHAEQPGQRVS